MSLTYDQLQARLNAYLAAEAAVLSAQEYELQPGDGTKRKVVRADLESIQAEIRVIRADMALVAPGQQRGVWYVS